MFFFHLPRAYEKADNDGRQLYGGIGRFTKKFGFHHEWEFWLVQVWNVSPYEDPIFIIATESDQDVSSKPRLGEATM